MIRIIAHSPMRTASKGMSNRHKACSKNLPVIIALDSLGDFVGDSGFTDLYQHSNFEWQSMQNDIFVLFEKAVEKIWVSPSYQLYFTLSFYVNSS